MNKKKIISSVLAAAFAFGSTTAFAQTNNAAATTVQSSEIELASEEDTFLEGELYYRELDNGTLEVAGTVHRDVGIYIGDGTIVIPSEVRGKRVTSIGENALYGMPLDTVTIPNSVTIIKEGAFFLCQELKSINIPNSVTSIEYGAFDECISLESITVPGVTNIGSRAFQNCLKLKTVTISGVGAGDISSDAFEGCRLLTAINVNGNNSKYCSVDGVLFNKDKTALIIFPTGRKGHYSIPDGVKNIEGAFIYCKGITSVTIPSSVESIKGSEFNGCINLTSINVEDGNSNYCSVDGVLFSKDKTTLIRYPEGRTSGYSIPDSVLCIDTTAFNDCVNLTSVTIPNSVERIEWGGFIGCTGLKTVTLPKNVSLGGSAFSNCENLTRVTIPDGVTYLNNGVFARCGKLTTVIMSDDIEEIERFAFDECYNLKNIYYAGTKEQWEKITISDYNDPLLNATIHYNSTGPTGTPVEVTIKAPEGVDISGQTATTTVNGKTKQLTVADDLLDVSGLADDTYTFTFKANNCVPRDYKVTVSGGAAIGLESGVKLNLIGDINGDGKLTLGDVLKANASARNSKPLTGYDKSVADINGDGKITLGDVLKMNAHARNSKLLW